MGLVMSDRLIMPAFEGFSEYKHRNEAICLNCRRWERQYPESDGRSVGLCKEISGTGWRYHKVPRGDNAVVVFRTRCDFGCNMFWANPPPTGRWEPELEDTP